MTIFLLLGIASTVAARPVQADALALGIGPQYSQISFAGSAGKTDAIYRGPGLILDVRLRLAPAPNFGDFGVDLFGLGELAYASNSASGVNETCFKSGFGGGMDVRSGFVFVGAQYEKTTSMIRAPDISTSSSFAAASLGFRGGVNWVVGEQSSVMLGAIYQAGTAYVSDNSALAVNQPVSQWSGFAVFHIKLTRDESKRSGIK